MFRDFKFVELIALWIDGQQRLYLIPRERLEEVREMAPDPAKRTMTQRGQWLVDVDPDLDRLLPQTFRKHAISIAEFVQAP
jgi:hypothetical protein